ncbi:hypothetical protein F5144DRAFT_95646 [Chaetomium tenue]|uniref:Uncharacterized protein n=1 Tax=Chaetomium tenue TaxID=1854479 RepID=A0ACB7PEW4_9PEZI|nr:hypothetical protein F5144DRAFT_95646 [Chaetomium globosum]
MSALVVFIVVGFCAGIRSTARSFDYLFVMMELCCLWERASPLRKIPEQSPGSTALLPRRKGARLSWESHRRLIPGGKTVDFGGGSAEKEGAGSGTYTLSRYVRVSGWPMGHRFDTRHDDAWLFHKQPLRSWGGMLMGACPSWLPSGKLGNWNPA